MKPNQIKLFANQPPITPADVESLTERGLIVPAKSVRNRPNCKDEITNSTAGDVVGYFNLNAMLKNGKVTQDDARRLLVLETIRSNGRPRKTHIDRLIVVAFAEDKSSVIRQIDKYRKQIWDKRAK